VKKGERGYSYENWVGSLGLLSYGGGGKNGRKLRLSLRKDFPFTKGAEENRSHRIR